VLLCNSHFGDSNHHSGMLDGLWVKFSQADHCCWSFFFKIELSPTSNPFRCSHDIGKSACVHGDWIFIFCPFLNPEGLLMFFLLPYLLQYVSERAMIFDYLLLCAMKVLWLLWPCESVHAIEKIGKDYIEILRLLRIWGRNLVYSKNHNEGWHWEWLVRCPILLLLLICGCYFLNHCEDQGGI
jgi:hypothetical protein